MNTPAAIESAMREAIRTFCGDSIPSAWLRCTQLQTDIGNEDASVEFPQVHVSAEPKAVGRAFGEYSCPMTVTVCTDSGIDADAQQRAGLFEVVERLVDRLHAPDTEEFAFFASAVAANIEGFHLGAVIPDGGSVGVSDGVYVMTLTAKVHFSQH